MLCTFCVLVGRNHLVVQEEGVDFWICVSDDDLPQDKCEERWDKRCYDFPLMLVAGGEVIGEL